MRNTFLEFPEFPSQDPVPGIGVWGLVLYRLLYGFYTVNPIKLEAGLRPDSVGIPYTLLLRIEAMGFPTLWLLL